MRKFTSRELGAQPLLGPFSRYLNEYETAILVALVKSVKPKVMIEFGVNAGLTAKCILQNVTSLERYIGIDVPPDYVPTLDCQRSEVPAAAGWYAAWDERFHLLSLSSQHVTADQLEPCDAVFIDGDHSEEAVLHESWIARTLVRPGGIICWHDFNNPAVEVTQALEQLENEGWPIHCVENSWIAFMRVEKQHAASQTAQR